ncbi:MAG: tripartite tricarboxylate transporter TctB family protein [Sphaerochaetaceae bacterium]
MTNKKLSGTDWAELGLLIFFLVYFIVLAFYTPQYTEKAALFPKICLIGGFVLLLAKFLALFFPQCKKVFEPEKVQQDLGLIELGEEKPNVQEQKEFPVKQILVMILWLMVTAFLFYLIGIIPAAFICSLFFFLLITKLKWYKGLLLSSSLGIVFYVVFDHLLKLKLYTGILF